jgi:hypothetical protein
MVAPGHHGREPRVRQRGGHAEGQVPRGARRGRQAVGESGTVPRRRLRGQRHLPPVEAEQPVGLAEGPVVVVPAPEDEPRELVVGGSQRQRVAREVAVGVRVVSVPVLVPALVVRRAAAGTGGEFLALPRAAGHGGGG